MLFADVKECLYDAEIKCITIDANKGHISLGGGLPYEEFLSRFVEECKKRNFSGITEEVVHDVIDRYDSRWTSSATYD